MAGAQLLIAMMYVKMDAKTFNIKGKINSCLIGEFSTYESRDWSARYKGFTGNLSPDLKTLCFSLSAH